MFLLVKGIEKNEIYRSQILQGLRQQRGIAAHPQINRIVCGLFKHPFRNPAELRDGFERNASQPGGIGGQVERREPHRRSQLQNVLTLEIVDQPEQQGTMLRMDSFTTHDFSQCPAPQLVPVLAIGIGYLIGTEKHLLPQQFNILETVIGTFFLDDLRDQVKHKRRMDPKSFPITDAPVQEHTFPPCISFRYKSHFQSSFVRKGNNLSRIIIAQ